MEHYSLHESQRDNAQAYVDDLDDEETGPLQYNVSDRAENGPSPDEYVPCDLLDSPTRALIVYIPLPFKDGAPVARTKAKNIVDDGIPPMEEHGDIASSDKASVPSSHEPCEIAAEALPHIKIDDAAMEHLLRQRSAAWTLLQTSGVAKFTYSSEASIATYVLSVLLDVESAIRHFLGPEYSLRIDNDIQTGENRFDVWVLLRNGKPVGVLEIKKRTRNSDVAMNHPNIIGECFDNMLALRAFGGIDNVYCILTNYHEWRVLCLPDTVEDAKSTVMPRDTVTALPSANSLLESIPAWPFSKAPATSGKATQADDSHDSQMGDDDSIKGTSQPSAIHPPSTALGDKDEVDRLVHATRVYCWNDPHLIEMIAAVLIKMAKSPATMLDDPLRADRPCRLLKEDTVQWTPWPAGRSVIFDGFPSSQFKNFMLLPSLGAGSNGQVYLASTVPSNKDKDKPRPGKGCVVKLPLASSTLSTEQQTQLFEQEADLWRTIWDAHDVRVQTLNKQPAIIMPYVKTCKGIAAEQPTDIKKAVIAAIDHMANRGYQHNEVRWEHVGLHQGQGGGVEAALIDLGNVSKIDTNNREEAKNEMCAALRL